MKLIVSVSRDVLESVEASQICICNVNEDTIGWSGGSIIARDSCFGLLANCWWVVVSMGIFGSLPLQL